jgi:hypothetical protein
MVIDHGAARVLEKVHLHGRHEMPENIGPDAKVETARLWVITLLGEAASLTST